MGSRGVLFPFLAVDPVCIGGMPPGKEDVFMRKGRRRGLSLLLVLVMLLGLLPGTAWAAGGEDGTVDVEINFDYRSVGESEALAEMFKLSLPTNQTVTVSVGSTIYDVLEAAKTKGGFTVEYDTGFGGVENGYVVGIGDIGEIKELCGNLRATYSDLFQYAGWTYTVDSQDGTGIQNDKVTEDCTVLFQYQVYSGYVGQNWTNFDIPFVDAYYGLKEELTEAEQLREDTFSGDWEALQNAIAQGKSVLTELEEADDTETLKDGLILNYLCLMQTAIWGGSNSPTGKLEGALRNLESAVRGEAVPEKVDVSNNLEELTVGQSYTITHTVLPENASQAVTYEAIVGGDCFTVSEAGEIMPTKSCNLCMIQVKAESNPSVSAWYSFKIIDAVQTVGDEEALLSNISDSYRTNSSEWTIMDMGAYAMIRPEGAKLDSQVRESYIDQTILTLSGDPSMAECAKGVLILSSLGVDPTALTLVDGTTINAVEKLKACTWDPEDTFFVYTAPYVLLAYQQGEWGTEKQEQELVDYLLGLQKEDGSWDITWGYDTMGMAIQGLAAYYGKQDAVTQALDRAVQYLRDTIQENGLYPNSYDEGISSAEVAIGLSAIGVDPATIQNSSTGTSLKDGILSKANEDNTAFTYKGQDNAGTTERCFRALIAMTGVAEKQSAYSVYDFTSIPKTGAQMSWEACPVKLTVVPGEATVVVTGSDGEETAKTGQLYDLSAGDYTYTVSCEGYASKTGEFTVTEDEASTHHLKTIYVSLTSEGGQGGGESTKYINITLKVMVPPTDTDRMYIYKNDRALYTDLLELSMPMKVESGSTVRDVLIQALDQQGVKYKEVSGGYFSSIGGWEEQGRFSTSGWMYMVGSQVPQQSSAQYVLTSSKEITWFYTDDYSKDYGSESWNGGTQTGTGAEIKEQADGSYQVTLPKDSTGSVLVTIPKVSEGDLLVIVHADGKQEVVKKSVVQDGTAYLMLDENATVKVVDYVSDFNDVKEDAWYADAVDFTAGRGLFSGVGGGSFAPDETLSRGMVVTVLYALEDAGAQKTVGLFDDVAEDAWYAQGTAWAVEAGIVSGYGDGQFGPNDAITREQLALMLYRYAQYMKLSTGTGASLEAFGDEEEISSWAQQAMSWAVSAGILGGTPEGNLNPGGTATRAEAAVMVSQFVAWMLKSV